VTLIEPDVERSDAPPWTTSAALVRVDRTIWSSQPALHRPLHRRHARRPRTCGRVLLRVTLRTACPAGQAGA
jgi:hypothetical protein